MFVLEENPNSKKNKTSAHKYKEQVDSNERKLNETKNKIVKKAKHSI